MFKESLLNDIRAWDCYNSCQEAHSMTVNLQSYHTVNSSEPIWVIMQIGIAMIKHNPTAPGKLIKHESKGQGTQEIHK